MNERSENLPAISVPHDIEGKVAMQRPFSRMTARRWLALALLLVCVTLGMLTSLLFLASRRDPTKMMGMLHSVSSQSLMIGESVITALLIAIAVTVMGRALSRPKRNDHFVSQRVESDTRAEDVSLAQLTVVEQILIQIVAEALGVSPEQIHRTGDFFEYGADSHSLNKVLSLVEQQLQVQIKADDVFDHPMLSQLAALITQRQ
jgi:acyl carrier protein